MKKEINNFYIVEEDDNIDTIAKKYKKSPIEILIKNGITPNMIIKEMVLYIN